MRGRSAPMLPRLSACAVAVLLVGCGAGARSTSTVDLAADLTTTIRDLQSFEATCSAPGAHPANCDQEQTLLTADVTKLRKAAPDWSPSLGQLPVKDALTAATGGLQPTTKLADTRVMRLLLERVRGGLGNVSPSLSHTTSNATLPPGYAKQLSLILPAVAIEISTAGSTCATPAVEPCEVELLIASAAVNRLNSAYNSLTVSPADQPFDAVLSPMLATLTSSLSTAVAAVRAAQPVDPALIAACQTDAEEFNSAAQQLAG